MIELLFANTTNPGVYFMQSNLAGKIVVVLLFSFSIIAWTVMLWKYWELSQMRDQARSQKKDLLAKRSLLEIANSRPTGKRGNYGLYEILFAALSAYSKELMSFGHPEDELSQARCMKAVENAMARKLSEIQLYYESKMVTLGSIVTGAPFLGLLGTVWGVMDAFGGVAGGGSATLQNLAPGVSGALLTTVAALLVAIPSVFGYNYLIGMIKEMSTEIENDASELSEQIEIELSLAETETPNRL